MWIISASGWLFKKKSVTMHGNMNVKTSIRSPSYLMKNTCNETAQYPIFSRLSPLLLSFSSVVYKFPPVGRSTTQFRDYTKRRISKQVFSSSNPIFTWAPDLGQLTHGYNPNFHYCNKLEPAALKFTLEIS